MARATRRTSTLKELDERLTRLERQVAEITKTVTERNRSTTLEIGEFRRAFIEAREEARRAFAETASRELVMRLHTEILGEIGTFHAELLGEIGRAHAEVMAQLSRFTSRPSEN
jgi:hypothetical protein